MGIFKAYDIRGLHPSEINPDIARKIGRAFSDLLGPGPVIVGRDVRVHSPLIAEAVRAGLCDVGREVIDIGLASTPMAYYAIGSREVAGGLVVTASHNPGEYNGMKLCREGARPIAYTTGIDLVEAACAGEGPPSGATSGSVEVLEEQGLYGYVKRIGGTSSGAITAAVLASGGGSQGLRYTIENSNFHDFLSDSGGVVGELFRGAKNYGVHSGNEFAKILQGYFERFSGNRNLTFQQLFEKSLVKP